MSLSTFVSNFLAARRRRNTILMYWKRLGRMLAQSYGRGEYYTPEQVCRTLTERGLPTDELVYALALYCTPEQFAADQGMSKGVRWYWRLRADLMEMKLSQAGSDVGRANGCVTRADEDALSGGGGYVGGGPGGGSW